MIQTLCMLFPASITVALRNHWRKTEKSLAGTFIEYALWALLVNFLMICTLIVFFDYGFIDFGSMSYSGIFTLKYILMASAYSWLLAYGSSKVRVWAPPIDNDEPAGKKAVKAKVRRGIGVLLLFVAALLFFSARWVIDTFGLLTPEELVFHLKVPLQGAESSFVKSYVLNCLVPAILLAAAFFAVFCWNWKREVRVSFSICQKKLQLKVFPYRWVRRHILIVSVLLLTASVVYFAVKMDIRSIYQYVAEKSAFIEENYVDTASVSLTFPEQKRNLVYVLMESMEGTYASEALGGAQPENLIPELTSLADANISFSNTDKLGGALQVLGTGWTIGAMVAQTTGLPLKTPINGNTYGEYASFLPGAYALSDILHEQGYNQALMVGSDAEFGGRKEFYEQHGDVTVYDYYTAIQDSVIDKDYCVWWGFEDQILYEYAKEKITALAEKGEPFSFTLLTADTHFPNGYVCALCGDKYDSQYSNVIACASSQVAQFVQWLQAQDFYDNTTVVIAGDHLSMDCDYFQSLDASYTRTTFNTFINSAVTTDYTSNRLFSTLDMFPTVLASMGVTIDGERLALGTNLFSGVPTLLEEYGFDTVNSELAKRSAFYSERFLYG